MSNYKCRNCGLNDVDNYGDLCDSCKDSLMPFSGSQQNPDNTMSTSGIKVNRKIYNKPDNQPQVKTKVSRKIITASTNNVPVNTYEPENKIVSNVQNSVVNTVSNPPQVSVATNTPVVNTQPYIVKGIVKNLKADYENIGFFKRWFRALFSSVPYAINKDITVFQIFPDYSGTTTNSSGNLADQVVAYGTLLPGMVSENNSVEVYGHRDTKGVIVLRKIRNTATGTEIRPKNIISPAVIRIVTILLLALIPALFSVADEIFKIIIFAIVAIILFKILFW